MSAVDSTPLHARFHRSISDIDAAAWNELNTEAHVFVQHTFLRALEQHGATTPALGWHPCHLTLEDSSGKLYGALPLYLRNHSFGDFSQDWQWPGAWQEAGLAYYPKLVSGIPFTPASGPRFLVHTGENRSKIVSALIAATLHFAKENHCSVWQCLFTSADDHQALSDAGLLLRSGNQFHWDNLDWRDFEHFLQAFSSDKRKKLKRERRRVIEAGITIEVRHGHQITAEQWPIIHRHYRSTFARYNNHPALNEDFFRDIGHSLSSDGQTGLVIFLARQGRDIIASAICYRDQHTLYGRHWGSDQGELPDTDHHYHSLHFELCYYQGIEYCIQHGLKRFEPGAHGEHKLSRGFAPATTASAYWIADPRMRAMVGNYLQREREQVSHYQKEMAEHLPYKLA